MTQVVLIRFNQDPFAVREFACTYEGAEGLYATLTVDLDRATVFDIDTPEQAVTVCKTLLAYGAMDSPFIFDLFPLDEARALVETPQTVPEPEIDPELQAQIAETASLFPASVA